MEQILKDIREKLREVYDPELGVNIVDLGLIYDISYVDGEVFIQMTLTTPGCPMHAMIVGGVKHALTGFEDITNIEVEIVWNPPWTPAHMSAEAKEILGF